MTHYGTLPDSVLGPLLAIVGGLVLALAWHYGDNVWTMVTTNRSDVGTVASDGVVEVSGRVHDVPEPLTAPVSGADCLSYTLEVEEYRRHDDVAKEWVDVDRIERGTEFVLTDDTGTVTVDPGPLDDFRYDVATPDRKSREVDEGASHGLEAAVAETGDDEYPRRYREERLSAEDTLYVLGTVADNGSRIENREGQPFIVSTDSESRTVVRHAAYALFAVGIGLALIGWGSYLVLGEIGLL